MKSLGKYSIYCMLLFAAVTFALPRHLIHTSLIEHALHDDGPGAELDHTDCAACECALANGLVLTCSIPLLAPQVSGARLPELASPQLDAQVFQARLRGPPAFA